MKKNDSYAAYIKCMAKIHGQDILPDVKLPRKPRKPRAKETAPRNLIEKELRKNIIEELKKHGWRYWRIENSISGRSSGMADLLIAKNRMIFIELKGTGGLTGRQPEFKEWCDKCSMPYFVVRTVEDLKIIIE